MNSGQFWSLDHLTDETVQVQLTQLLASAARTEARIIAHIAAIEDRRLHLRSGCSSLFAYCVERLGLSENEAFHRLTAARLARRFPIIFRLVEEHEIHLTGVCLLRDYLNQDNHVELLVLACGKTKFQIMELLARRFPRADLRSSLRKLPTPTIPMVALTAVPATLVSSPPVTPATPVTVTSLPATPVTVTSIPATPVTVTSIPATPSVPSQAKGPHSRPRIQPTAPDRYRLQLNLSAMAREKLELARALLSHSVPNGDLAAVVERALDELLVQLKKKRFGQTSKPRTRTTFPRKKTGTADASGRRPHITQATRREVIARDGLQCSFEGEDGHRCTSIAFLQLHHDQAWARNGGSGSDNLKVLCAGHNRLLAERDFGREKIAKFAQMTRRTGSKMRADRHIRSSEDRLIRSSKGTASSTRGPPRRKP